MDLPMITFRISKDVADSFIQRDASFAVSWSAWVVNHHRPIDITTQNYIMGFLKSWFNTMCDHCCTFEKNRDHFVEYILNNKLPGFTVNATLTVS